MPKRFNAKHTDFSLLVNTRKISPIAYIHSCVCVRACMHACMYVCMYVCIHICISVCMYVSCMYVLCIYECMYICISVCMYVSCMYVLCIYVCMWQRLLINWFITPCTPNPIKRSIVMIYHRMTEKFN